MPRLSIEATIGIGLEIVLGILDHLHVKEPLIVWGLFALGFLLISDSILRSEWASSSGHKWSRMRRSIYGMSPVIIFFSLFGWWIFGRNKVVVPPQVTAQANPAPQMVPPSPTSKVETQHGAEKKAKTPRPDAPKPTVQPPATIISAPNGIAIGGGTVTNPTVNNFAPPQRHLSSVLIDERAQCLAQRAGVVAIISISGNAEAYKYAQDWAALFKAAHWTLKDGGIGSFMPAGVGLPTGTRISIKGTWNKTTNQSIYDPDSPEGVFVNCFAGKPLPGDTGGITPYPDMTGGEVRVMIYPPATE